MRARPFHLVAPLLVLTAGVAVVVVHEDAAAGGPCGSAEALPAADILACLDDAVAYVTTPVGSGSGILLADGHMVTNAHVVDPFGAVDVTFVDGETVEDVPVLGVDLLRDVAVLGPLDHPGGVTFAPVEAIDALVQGDELFLVGYPGENEETPEVTIARGILSRTRALESFDQTYLQTDAAIGGGQSGGALVDELGNVVGLSTLRFAEEFALALESVDVEDAVAGILAGRGDAYSPAGHDAATSGSFYIDGDDHHVLSIAPSPEDQTVRVEAHESGWPVLVAYDWMGTPLAVPALVLEQFTADEFGVSQQEYDALAANASDQPNIVEFVLPAETLGIVEIGTANPDGANVSFSSSVPVGNHVDGDDGTAIAVGDRVTAAIDAFEFADTYTVVLAEGEAIEVAVRSPAGDPLFVVHEPGAAFEELEPVDDAADAEGLYGYDAVGTFTAPAAGTYVIRVGVWDFLSTGYTIELTAA